MSQTSVNLAQQGHEKLRLGDYHAALDLYGKALEKTKLPAHKISLHFSRAFCYDKTNQLRMLLEEITHVLEISPNNASALKMRADTLERMNELRAALIDTTRLLELEPNNKVFRELDRKIKLRMKTETSLNPIVEEDFTEYPDSISKLKSTAVSETVPEGLNPSPVYLPVEGPVKPTKSDYYSSKVKTSEKQPQDLLLEHSLTETKSSELSVSIDKLTISESKMVSKYESLLASNNLKLPEVNLPSLPRKDVSSLSKTQQKYRRASLNSSVSLKGNFSNNLTGNIKKEGEQKITSSVTGGLSSKILGAMLEVTDAKSKVSVPETSKSEIVAKVNGDQVSLKPAIQAEKKEVTGIPLKVAKAEVNQSGNSEKLASSLPKVKSQEEIMKEVMENQARRQNGSFFSQRAQQSLNSGHLSVSGAKLPPPSVILTQDFSGDSMAVKEVEGNPPERKQNLDFSRYKKWDKLDVSDSDSEEEQEKQPQPGFQYKVKGVTFGKYAM